MNFHDPDWMIFLVIDIGFWKQVFFINESMAITAGSNNIDNWRSGVIMSFENCSSAVSFIIRELTDNR